MTCPEPIASVLLDILQQGLLACRAFGWQGDARRCAIEADHLHNIPSLLSDYSPDRLRVYWDVERPAFAAQCDPNQMSGWQSHWDRLEPFVEEAELTVAS
jgi:hypothetical protein